MIYFIQAGNAKGPVKIGYTSHDTPYERMAVLQTGNPYKLSCVLILPGNKGKERELHQEFSKYRLEGEWFKAAPELTSYIKRWNSNPNTPTIAHSKPTARRKAAQKPIYNGLSNSALKKLRGITLCNLPKSFVPSDPPLTGVYNQ
jgi:hypothetical protein